MNGIIRRSGMQEHNINAPKGSNPYARGAINAAAVSTAAAAGTLGYRAIKAGDFAGKGLLSGSKELGKGMIAQGKAAGTPAYAALGGLAAGAALGGAAQSHLENKGYHPAVGLAANAGLTGAGLAGGLASTSAGRAVMKTGFGSAKSGIVAGAKGLANFVRK